MKAGFSLIELLVALVIVAVLTAIAVPTYTSHLRKVRRSDAKAAVLNAAARIEQYYTDNNTYASATLNNLGVPAASSEGYYSLALSNLGTDTFTITATAQGVQLNDTACRSFSFDQLGQKTAKDSAGNATTNCWQ